MTLTHLSPPHPETPYVGRFAPSPTGPLHIGSLLAALASYLDARAHRGRWLLRMEDLDPPREQPGAAQQILDTLTFYGLQWDGDVVYQSQRHSRYQEKVDQLLQNRKAFYCTCSRTDIQRRTGSTTYPGTCRGCFQRPEEPSAVRVTVPDADITFHDLLQGAQQTCLRKAGGDFVIQRKEGLYAYHLAVVTDDAMQGVTHIVRGCDLLHSTFSHWHLQTLLDLPHPVYAHLPVFVNEQGQKLSKQTFAEPLPRDNPVPALLDCLIALGQQPPASLKRSHRDTVLEWASEHWQLDRIPATRALQHPGG